MNSKPKKEMGMMMLAADNLTDLLTEWRQGDQAALNRLAPLVYDELRRIAHRYVQRERNGRTLGTTALVHEAYLRLAGQKKRPGPWGPGPLWVREG